MEKFCLRLSARLTLNSLISDAISTADFHESFCVFINRFCRVIDRRITSSISNMKRRNNKFEHCFRSLTVLTRSTTKCTPNPVGKKLDTPAIEFEATAFKAAFCSLFFEIPSQPCQHWRTHYIPLSPPLRISFWAWADRRANNTHALPDVRDLRTSGNCCYQSPPFRRPRDQKKRRLWGREWPWSNLYLTGPAQKNSRIIALPSSSRRGRHFTSLAVVSKTWVFCSCLSPTNVPIDLSFSHIDKNVSKVHIFRYFSVQYYAEIRKCE